MYTFNDIYLSIIVIFGLLGNAYCIRRIRRSSLRRFAVSYYLLALAISDSGFLLSLTTIVLYNFEVELLNLPVICQSTYFLSYLSCFLSGWYTVAFSVERCLAVYRPFQSYVSNSYYRSKLVILIITCIGMVLNSWPFFVFESRASEATVSNISMILYDCDTRNSSFNYLNSITFFDSLISCGIPIVLISVSNIIIAKQILDSQNIRRSLMNSSSSKMKRPLSVKRSGCGYQKIRINERKIILLLLAIPFAHVILNLPNYLLRFIVILTHSDEDKTNPVYLAMDKIFLFMFYSQFSVNFIFYSCQAGWCSCFIKSTKRRSSAKVVT